MKHVTHYRLDAGTFGTMGVGLGFAIAAAAVEKSSSGQGQRIVCVEGDSAFGFSGMEVETMCRWAHNFYIILAPTTCAVSKFCVNLLQQVQPPCDHHRGQQQRHIQRSRSWHVERNGKDGRFDHHVSVKLSNFDSWRKCNFNTTNTNCTISFFFGCFFPERRRWPSCLRPVMTRSWQHLEAEAFWWGRRRSCTVRWSSVWVTGRSRVSWTSWSIPPLTGSSR